MEKIKISDLLKETKGIVLTYSSAAPYTPEGEFVSNKKEKLDKIINTFKRKTEMFDYLSDARTYLNSPKESVGFFIRESEDENTILVTRLYFIIGLSMSMHKMDPINYKKFFDEFIDLENKSIKVIDPEN